jgi:DNA polymerase III subunit epsilon
VAAVTDPWHLGMLCAFDVESTGVDPATARIVTACIAYLDGEGKIPPQPLPFLIDPGVEIPEEAAAIHGITTEHAREHGQPAARAVEEISGELLRSAAALIPLIAFNAPYDFTVLDRETRRHDLKPFGPELENAKGVVVDPYVLDKALDPYRKGRRTLAAVAEHYGVKAGQAHDAAGDAITAARVAWKIAAVYPHIGRMSPTELHAFQVKAKRDQSRSFRDYLRRQGSNEVVDESWPLRAWPGDSFPEAAAS